MSAICGAISLNQSEIPRENINILKNAFSDCVIDRWEMLEKPGVFMRCGIQYFTKESRLEMMPVEEDGIYFNADVVVDNRRELYEALKEKGRLEKSYEETSDGELLKKGLSEYTPSGLRKILGAYVFVSFDRKSGKVILASDAVGGRYVYYLIQDGILYYASLMKPLISILHEVQVNDRWVADFIGQDNLNMYTESEENPILNIYRTPPSHYVEITAGKRQVIRYWDPVKDGKKIQCKDDAGYKRLFINLFTQCVEEVLRTEDETGILLSGGYDSSAVAVVASKILKERNKKLFSYTSVPFQGYKSDFDRTTMTDETELVKKTADFLGNLECEFMDMPQADGWTARKEYVEIAEIPYKSPQNLLWMYEGYKQARVDNVRIMLGGMFGNGTISYDNAQLYMVWLLRHFRVFTFYKELNGLRNRHHYTRKSVLKTSIKQALGITRYPKMTEEYFQKGYARYDFLESQGTVQRLIKRENKMYADSVNIKRYHQAFMPTETMRHYGEFAQKNSLHTGVLLRDPTRDPRVIEFTLHIPENQFTHNGYMRRLITDYMGDVMPPHVVAERRTGRQSADLKARILQKEERIKAEWIGNYQKFRENPRIDCEKALEDLRQREISDMSDFEIVRHIFTNILLEYLKEIE